MLDRILSLNRLLSFEGHNFHYLIEWKFFLSSSNLPDCIAAVLKDVHCSSLKVAMVSFREYGVIITIRLKVLQLISITREHYESG
jgi:hypothetical protein